jgi:hypothetical protein
MPNDFKILKHNPFFNKVKFPEREIILKSPNLFHIGQIEMKDYKDQSKIKDHPINKNLAVHK